MAFRRSIAPVPMVLGAWIVCAAASMAGDGPSAAWSWHVPIAHFVWQSGPADAATRGEINPITTDGQFDDPQAAFLGRAGADAMSGRSFAGLPVHRISTADRAAFLQVPCPNDPPPTAAAAAMIDLLAESERIDPRRFSRLLDRSFFDPPAAQPTEDFAPAASIGQYRPWPSIRSENLPPARTSCWDGIDQKREPFAIALPRQRPTAPPGTMFIWSVAGAVADSSKSMATGTRQAPVPSAGVVLTRPPGDYSLDWVGVAVSAPLH